MALKTVMHSVLRGTLAEILASTGAYIGQQAFATDYGVGTAPNQPGMELYWNGAAWRLPVRWQLMAMIRAQVVVPATNVETDVMTVTLPALGPNTLIRVCHFWTLTSNANAKNARVRIDGTSATNLSLASAAAANMITEGRNMNDASVQKWGTNNTSIYSANSGTLQGTTAATGTAGKILKLTGQNSTAADVMNLEYGDIWLCGGGTA